MMVHRILVGQDRSEESLHALEFALWLAKATRAHLTLMHLWSRKFPRPVGKPDPDAAELLTERKALVRKRRVPVEVQLVHDWTTHRLVRHAMWFDLVLTGKRGLGGRPLPKEPLAAAAGGKSSSRSGSNAGGAWGGRGGRASGGRGGRGSREERGATAARSVGRGGKAAGGGQGDGTASGSAGLGSLSKALLAGSPVPVLLVDNAHPEPEQIMVVLENTPDGCKALRLATVLAEAYGLTLHVVEHGYGRHAGEQIAQAHSYVESAEGVDAVFHRLEKVNNVAVVDFIRHHDIHLALVPALAGPLFGRRMADYVALHSRCSMMVPEGRVPPIT